MVQQPSLDAAALHPTALDTHTRSAFQVRYALTKHSRSRSHSPSPLLNPQAAAGMGIYGPRTVFCIALKDYPGCHEFLLMDDGKWMHVKETTEIGEP